MGGNGVNMKTVFISGSITNDLDDYKYKFNSAELDLIKRGYVVLNPAWLPIVGFSYEAYMRISMAMLKEREAIYLLKGWEESEGACCEKAYAEATGMEIMYDEEALQANGR